MQRSFSNNAILYYGLVCSYEQQRKKLSLPQQQNNFETKQQKQKKNFQQQVPVESL